MAVAWKKVVTTSDIIPVAQGGTGVNTLSDGGVLIGNGDGDVQVVDMADNAILIGVGSGADPVARTVTHNQTSSLPTTAQLMALPSRQAW